jgi:hypothetical protein
MMYYRYQNTNYPNLPDRIRLADGSTRTSLNELSEAELLAMGIEFIEGDYPVPPTQPTPLTHKQFMDRFTDTELATIMTAAKSSIELELWFKRFEMAQEIILSDPQTVTGVHALETAELIAEGRAAEILNG